MKKENLSPEVVVGVFIQNKKGEIALFKSSKWKNVWIQPGGHVEYGEKLEEAVKRETKEEVGAEVDQIKLIRSGESINNPEFHKKAHLIFFHFLCRLKSAELKIDHQEIIDYRWFSIDEIFKSKEVGIHTKESVQKVKNLIER